MCISCSSTGAINYILSVPILLRVPTARCALSIRVPPLPPFPLGFPVLQWWASVGLVSCYWLMGKESLAEDFYPNIEALSDEMGAAVPSALQLAFKASRMYKRPSGATKMPLEVVIQLCATTSNSLEGSVANLMQDHSNSAQTRLYQVICWHFLLMQELSRQPASFEAAL